MKSNPKQDWLLLTEYLPTARRLRALCLPWVADTPRAGPDDESRRKERTIEMCPRIAQTPSDHHNKTAPCGPRMPHPYLKRDPSTRLTNAQSFPASRPGP